MKALCCEGEKLNIAFHKKFQAVLAPVTSSIRAGQAIRTYRGSLIYSITEKFLPRIPQDKEDGGYYRGPVKSLARMNQKLGEYTWFIRILATEFELSR